MKVVEMCFYQLFGQALYRHFELVFLAVCTLTLYPLLVPIL